jgi:hypothetical protein
MPKKPSKIKETAVPMSQVAMEILHDLLNSCAERHVKLAGTVSVDHPKCGKFPMVFFVKECGEYLVWFVENGMHKLYSLVNENQEEVLEFPSDRLDEFQEHLTKLKVQLDA